MTTPAIAHRSPRLPATFWDKTSVQPNGCWLWTAATNSRGYGVVRHGGQLTYAHRLAFSTFVSEIPARTQVDHVCHDRRCVRPEHLRLASNKQNQENRSGAQRGSATGIRGVYRDARTNRYYVQVGHNGIVHSGGSFTDLDTANAAAVSLRNDLFTHNAADRASVVPT